MNKLTLICLLITCSFFGVACKQLEQVEEMHDSTLVMKENTALMASTTASMSETTNNMSGMSSDLRELSAWMLSIMKQGDTSRLRDEAIKDMISAQTFTRKSLMASKYFYAFEYQIWNSIKYINNVDPLEIREKMKAAAVIEYAKTLAEFMPANRKETGTSDQEEMRNFYALVATMHKVNDYQQELINSTGPASQRVAVTNMHLILDEALSVANKLDQGEISLADLSPAQLEVLKEEDTFIYALKIRYRFLAAMSLSRISNLAEASFIEKAQMLLFKWTPDFLKEGKMNLEEINYAAEILRYAKATGDVLAKRSIHAQLDKKVVKIYKNMQRKTFSEDKLSGEALLRVRTYNRALNEFYTALDTLLKDNASEEERN